MRAFTGVTPASRIGLKQPDQHGVDDHVGPAGGQLAVVADAERLDAAVAHLRQERAEPLAELEERLQPLEFLGRHRREVDGVADDAVPQEVAQRRHRFHADQLLPLARRRGDVRRGHDLRQHLQPVIDGRLLLEDVERRAADLARFDRVGQRALVDQVAARGVDDADALLRLRASRSALTMFLVVGVDGMCSER